MLVEIAVGDAYGAGFEYVAAPIVEAANTVTGYVRHPRHDGVRPGSYTDDTQMTIAVAEVLVSGLPWTREHLADAFVTAFHRDRRDGYAGGFHRLLLDVSDGAELLARLRPASERNGAAMRVGPLGLLPTVDDVLHHAEVQARITHDTPIGVEAAQAAALAVHYCHHDLGPVVDTGRWIERQLAARGGAVEWSLPWRGKVDDRADQAVRAAITALVASTGLRELLHACVAHTGDVDTVAAIAMSAASRAAAITDDLPAALYDDLEDGPYGRTFLSDLDTRLLTAV